MERETKMDASEATKLYLLERSNAPLWLVPDSAGVPTVLNPQPFLLRVTDVPSTSEQDMQVARVQLTNENCWLFAPTVCPDGPPYRSGRVFVYQSQLNGMKWQDGSLPRFGGAMRLYCPATKNAPWNWVDQLRREQYGFFMTGPVGSGSLWRLFRAEIDALERWVLTLSPVRSSSACPQADFSTLKAPLLADEVSAQYRDLANAVTANSYREVVTKAKNIVEAIVADRLGTAENSRDLSENLRAIRNLLDSSKSQENCRWTHLEYHLAHKIRLVHGQTHATAAARTGRPLRPEFALSCVEDLIELLHIWGYCTN